MMPRLPLPPLRLSAILAVSQLVAGCVDAMNPFVRRQAQYVSAVGAAGGILVTNQTDLPIGLFAIEEGTLALVNMALPCSGGSPCTPALLAGEQKLVPWATVLGADAAKMRYRVGWWHIEPHGNGGHRATDGGHILVAR